jgi:hypothetical protein
MAIKLRQCPKAAFSLLSILTTAAIAGGISPHYASAQPQVREVPPAVIPPPGIELGAPDYVPNPHRGHFSLAILQGKPLLTQVVARVSLKSKRVNGFLDERFLGDYLYEMNQRASFLRGSNPEDRVIVRLFDLQNRLLGYTEFELLDDNAAVSLVLPSQPEKYGLMRTVVGIDSDRDGTIDSTSKVYDYFTQVNLPPDQKLASAMALFLGNAANINLNLFKVDSLSVPTRNSTYPNSFATGNFGLANLSTPIFKPWLSPTIIVLPGQVVSLITIKPGTADMFDITRQILNYNEIELNQTQNTVFQPPKAKGQ